MRVKIILFTLTALACAGCTGQQVREASGALAQEFVEETFELALDLALGNEIDSKEDARRERDRAIREARESSWRQAAYSASINAHLNYVQPPPADRDPRSIVMAPEPFPPPPSAVRMLDGLAAGEISPD